MWGSSRVWSSSPQSVWLSTRERREEGVQSSDRSRGESPLSAWHVGNKQMLAFVVTTSPLSSFSSLSLPGSIGTTRHRQSLVLGENGKSYSALAEGCSPKGTHGWGVSEHRLGPDRLLVLTFPDGLLLPSFFHPSSVCRMRGVGAEALALRQNWCEIQLCPPFSSSVTLGKPLYCSMPQFLHPQNGNKKSPSSEGIERIKEENYASKLSSVPGGTGRCQYGCKGSHCLQP